MYEYNFITIKVSQWTGKPKEKLEDVVREQAKKGWRLVQVIKEQYGNYQIIFERLF
ncbi:MAG: DUF4177 domain-containing protein [Bacteroidetes bacterium]|nr:MAG: DUF4177 domain-containing protein [Bacteroidota bacterium]TAG86968.1 MAG: DUF4177 domain-containing protein [Bacteroidota bacterium]